MAATIEGTTLQAQATEIEADSVSGSVVLRWRGTRTELEAYAVSAGITTGGHKWSIVPDGEIPELAILTWTIATGSDGSSAETDDPISTDWDIQTPSEIVPLSEHPDWVEQMTALESADPLFHAAFKSWWAGEIQWEDLGDAAIDDLIADYPLLYDFAQDKREGVTGYFRGAPSLTVIDRYQRQAPNAADTATVNVAYTTTQLITALQSRAAGGQMPADIANNLATGEWLCEAVTRRAASDGSREVTQVFRFAPKWKDHIYAHAP